MCVETMKECTKGIGINIIRIHCIADDIVLSCVFVKRNGPKQCNMLWVVSYTLKQLELKTKCQQD